MLNELHLEGAGHEVAPQKKGIYRELRANPYLLGLSTVCISCSIIKPKALTR